jgi:hypothetical protein
MFDVIRGIAEDWVGGTPWMAMTPAERSAVDRFLYILGQAEAVIVCQNGARFSAAGVIVSR